MVRRFRALDINDKMETENMSDDDKKKVVLGTTLALLLGAGSYWFLGSGGGRDSDGLNSQGAGKKVARATPSDDSGGKVARRPPTNDRKRPPDQKVKRDGHIAKRNNDKTRRGSRTNKVIKEPKRRPQA